MEGMKDGVFDLSEAERSRETKSIKDLPARVFQVRTLNPRERAKRVPKFKPLGVSQCCLRRTILYNPGKLTNEAA